MIRCGCANCMTRNRYLAIYKKFLEDYPKEVAFIRKQMKIDKTLTCLRKETYELSR